MLSRVSLFLSHKNYRKALGFICRKNSASFANMSEEKKWETVTENSATIYFKDKNAVFYNNVQEFNRDLSIASITQFAKVRDQEIKAKNAKKAKNFLEREANAIAKAKEKGEEYVPIPPPQQVENNGIRILEALSATGLRSIRMWKEIEKGLVNEIVVNDLDQQAVEAIERNLDFNKCPKDKVKPNKGDAIDVMYADRCTREREKGFDVIDLDPYGSAAEFMDAAVQAVKDGGLLCVTCTDKAILCGSKNAETCYGKYASMPLKAPYCHEMAIRILLQALEKAANKYHRYIIPQLSMSIDFYVRVFVRVKTSKLNVKMSASKMTMVYQSLGCDAFYLQPMGQVDMSKKTPKFDRSTGPPCTSTCPFTGSRMKFGGPFWSDALHNKEFVKNLIQHIQQNPKKYGTEKRMLGQLKVVQAELDLPLYYSHESLVRLFHTSAKLRDVRSGIINAGYKVSQSHADPNAIKTNAPPNVVFDVMRYIVNQNPEQGKAKRGPDTNSGKIMAMKPETKVELALAPGAEGLCVAAFLPNPEENWGPKARATGTGKRKLTTKERSKLNQGKRSKKNNGNNDQ